jgi:hypothetical protein
MDRYEELLSEYLDGSLDAAGKTELAALVESDPERLRELVDLVREGRILSAELGEFSAEEFTRRVIADLEKDKTRFVRAVMSDVRGGGSRPSGRPRWQLRPSGEPGSAWVTWAAIAAGAAVVLGLLIFAVGGGSDDPRPPQVRNEKKKPAPAPEEKKQAPAPVPKAPEVPALPKPATPSPAPEERVPPKPEAPRSREPETPKPEAPKPVPPEKKPVEKPTVVEVATLERVEGNVTVREAAAQSGIALTAGFSVETADERSAAVIRYPDGTRIELKGASGIRDASDGPGRRVIVSGTIVSEIAKLPGDQPMIFVTAQAEARIVGTKIRIEAAAEFTRLDVSEGRVKFTRLKDKMSVDVAAGHSAMVAPNTPLASKLTRATEGLAALYTFKEGRGAVVRDVSRAGAPIDLKIENETAVRWSPKGLSLVAPTLVASTAAATRITQACKASNEVTLEAWFRPATVTPASKDGRILTLSADFMDQDFMLGQDELKGPAKSYFVRLRTTMTDRVGKPALPTPDGTATVKLTHVVYTRAASGAAALYVDGVEVARATVAGNLSTWNEGYRLGLGNEFSNDRPWLGELHLAAVYSRALSAEDVRQNQRAGAD